MPVLLHTYSSLPREITTAASLESSKPRLSNRLFLSGLRRSHYGSSGRLVDAANILIGSQYCSGHAGCVSRSRYPVRQDEGVDGDFSHPVRCGGRGGAVLHSHTGCVSCRSEEQRSTDLWLIVAETFVTIAASPLPYLTFRRSCDSM